MDEGRLEAKHGELDYRDSSDGEEVKLLLHRKGADGPDPPGEDICEVPEASDTQWDEGLPKTEPLQGARPKWNKGGGGGDLQWYPTRRGSWTYRSRWGGGGRPERGTSRRSDPSVATGSAVHARGGSDHATEEGNSQTWRPSGS